MRATVGGETPHGRQVGSAVADGAGVPGRLDHGDGGYGRGHAAAVTVGLRIDVAPRWVEEPVIVASARAVSGAQGWLLASGELVSTGELVGSATIRCRPVESRGRPRPPLLSEGHFLLLGRRSMKPVPWTGFLGVRAVQAGAGTGRVTAVAKPQLANGAGTLHGGAIAGLGLRAASGVLEPGRSWIVLGFAIDFLRPVPADGTVMHVGATAVDRTRSLVWTETVVTRQDGRPAARVRCLHAVG